VARDESGCPLLDPAKRAILHRSDWYPADVGSNVQFRNTPVWGGSADIKRKHLHLAQDDLPAAGIHS
jgi:hypothetical protein